MANEKPQNSPSDIAKSYVALHTLRDYLYQQKPKSLLATDFVEDIPSLRPFGSAFSNILPSAAIISKDPAERHKQINQALHSIRQASKKDHPVAQEALASAAKFGLGSIPLSLAFGLAEKSLHIPKLHEMLRGQRPRVTLKENFATPEKRKELRKYLGDSVKAGVVQGAVFGATPVLLSNSSKFDKKHLDSAAKVLNEHPNISALPGADLAALNNQNKNKKDNPTFDHLKNMTYGGLAGGGGALAVQGSAMASKYLSNQIAPTLTKIHNSRNHGLLNFNRWLTPRGKSSIELKGTGLRGSKELNRKDPTHFKQIHNTLKKHFPTNFKPHLYNKSEILEPLTWKSMKKPVLGLAALGVGLSGLGSYLSHPAHKNE